MEVSELIAYWFEAFFLDDTVREKTIETIVCGMKYLGSDVNMPMASRLLALANFYGLEDMVSSGFSEVYDKADPNLVADFTSFLRCLDLKQLDTYYMHKLQSSTAVEKLEAVASLKNRLGHDEYQYDTQDPATATKVTVHDYNSVTFTDAASRDAALQALTTTPPAEINGIAVASAETITIASGAAIHFTLADGTEIVAYSHTLTYGDSRPAKNMILFHVLHQADIADPAGAEAEKTAALQNAHAILNTLRR